MSSNRLEVLKSLVTQNPADAFARYGLAMELVERRETGGRRWNEFRQLLAANPNYAAGYFHGGQTLEKARPRGRSAGALRAGNRGDRRTGDAHTRGELQGALDLLPI